MPKTPAVLSLEEVSVSFGGVHALSSVSFSVEPGEVVALIGPNGAGKTTILNAISGLLGSRVKGTIRIDGVALNGLRAAEVARRGVGRSFQNPPLLERETVLENVMTGAHLRLGYRLIDQYFRWGKVSRAERELSLEAMGYLRAFGIEQDATKVAGRLPYAVSKMADISRGMLMRPRILLLDEPTSGIGPTEQAAVVDVLRALKRKGDTSVILVEHHMDVIRRIADKAIGLQAGSVIKVGTPQEVLDSDDFKEVLVGGRRSDNGNAGEQS